MTQPWQLPTADIRINAANIVLDGTASQIVDALKTDALGNFTTNTATGSFTIQNGRNFATGGSFANLGVLTIGAGSTFSATGALSNFSGNTLTDGAYVVGGTFQFPGAGIRINAATLVLDGSASHVLDDSNADALANFAGNEAAGTFTVQNGRNLTVAAFNNAGNLIIGTNSTFTV